MYPQTNKLPEGYAGRDETSCIGGTSAIQNVHNTLNEAQSLSARVEALVDRLLGPCAVEGACAPRSEPLADGVFSIMDRHASSTSSVITRANIALNRLENQLP